MGMFLQTQEQNGSSIPQTSLQRLFLTNRLVCHAAKVGSVPFVGCAVLLAGCELSRVSVSRLKFVYAMEMVSMSGYSSVSASVCPLDK